MTMNDSEWQRLVKRVTLSDTTNGNEWQPVTTNDNEWQWMTTSDSEWQRVVQWMSTSSTANKSE